MAGTAAHSMLPPDGAPLRRLPPALHRSCAPLWLARGGGWERRHRRCPCRRAHGCRWTSGDELPRQAIGRAATRAAPSCWTSPHASSSRWRATRSPRATAARWPATATGLACAKSTGRCAGRSPGVPRVAGRRPPCTWAGHSRRSPGARRTSTPAGIRIARTAWSPSRAWWIPGGRRKAGTRCGPTATSPTDHPWT